jgi:hypothetical protein
MVRDEVVEMVRDEVRDEVMARRWWVSVWLCGGGGVWTL